VGEFHKEQIMFKKAIPVFAKGEDNSLNYHLALCAEVESLENTKLYISAFSFYRLYVNGTFVCMGPARTAGGYARVDEIELDKFNAEGKINTLEIQVTGYNCNSLSTVNQTSFVVCELRCGDDVLLYTGRDFDAYSDCRRVREVQRFSAQRHFGEIWKLDGKDFRRTENKVELVAASNTPKYLERHVPMPSYDTIHVDGYKSIGKFEYDESLTVHHNFHSFYCDKRWGAFDESEIKSFPYDWLQQQHLIKHGEGGELPVKLCAGEYIIVDLEKIETGFLRLVGKADENSDIVVGYTERPSDREFAFTEIHCHNVIEYFVDGGVEFDVQSFEPYTCRVAVIMVRSGKVEISSFALRTYEFDRSRFIKRKINDAELAKIYKAAESTFAHNALDLYSDCPSRERAGWLCDSYFTGQSEYFLTGDSIIEDAFLENFRLYESRGEFPEGALPMCYPSDKHVNFIPQWDMWYVLEVKDYLTVRRPNVDKELFRKSVFGILGFLERHENSDGLLQNLPGWNFVEWSTANEWVQDVNYPTNFLYAEVLRAIGTLYGRPELLDKAEKVAEKTRELAFDGEFFVDNAVKDENGVLRNTKHMSEAGQYYALLFGNVDIDAPKYASLKKNLDNGFADFDAADRHFVPVNAFIGLYLRILLLIRLGKKDILENDIKSFFGGMVESTGTLWEYKQLVGSHDHGFASLAALAIDFVEQK